MQEFATRFRPDFSAGPRDGLSLDKFGQVRRGKRGAGGGGAAGTLESLASVRMELEALAGVRMEPSL